ncbi:hypothetical protein VTJ04DRAFT_1965 [Mycothermus thermophilus]|uniref:uncharacterized protein n=1 Tax=Humicola insolens TaxID=85995 RepID=UPI0037422950
MIQNPGGILRLALRAIMRSLPPVSPTHTISDSFFSQPAPLFSHVIRTQPSKLALLISGRIYLFYAIVECIPIR